MPRITVDPNYKHSSGTSKATETTSSFAYDFPWEGSQLQLASPGHVS